MKLLILPFTSFFTISGFSQKATSEFDKFSKQKKVETNYETLISRLGKGLSVKLRSAGESNFILFAGYGYGTGVVGNDDQAILLLDNDSTVTVFSTGIQTYEIGKYNNTFRHQYRIDTESLALLEKHNVKSIRRYINEGYADIDIPEKHQDDIKKLCGVFMKEKLKP